MKTKQEIEKMKDDIQLKIDEIQERMARTNNIETLQNLSDRKRQYIAQYNILLEVMK